MVEFGDIEIEIPSGEIAVTICLNALDEFDHILNMVCCFADDIGLPNIQALSILKKSVGIELGNFKH